MMIINQTFYSQADLKLVFLRMEAIPAFTDPVNRLFMICSNDPFLVICAVLYLRTRGASVFLLHGDTPLETALAQAGEAGCHYCITGDLFEPRSLLRDHVDARTPPALYQLSSGTTGKPKRIGRTWREVETEIAEYNRVLRSRDDEVPVILVPATHSFGLVSGVLSALSREVVPIIISEKNPKFVAKVLREHDRSIVYAVPFQLRLLMTMPSARAYMYKAVSSGAPLPEALLQEMKDSVGIIQQYGCTETGCIALCHHPRSAIEVGKALGHLEVTIDEEEPGLGEIVVSRSDAITHTRDIGFMDGDGSLHVKARKDDLINVSGLKVIPQEVERVIGHMDQVDEVLVYAGDHPVWGQSVKALVTLFSAIDPNEIRLWCAQRLPSYMIPGEIRMVSELPKTSSGKVSRKLAKGIGDAVR